MKYKARKEGPITIVTITGNMVGGAICDEFRQYMESLVEEGARHVIFDLTDVHYVASAGAGLIVAAFTSLKNRGGDLRLVVATERVRNLLHLIRLYRMMKVYETLAEAIASCKESVKAEEAPAEATHEAKA